MSDPNEVQINTTKWVNASIVLICTAILGYSLYHFSHMNSLPKSDTDAPKAVMPSPVIEIAKKEVVASETLSLAPAKDTSPTATLIPVVDSTPALPVLNQSDPFVLLTLGQISQQIKTSPHLQQHDLLRTSIVFMDNFSQGIVVRHFSPLQAPKTPFSVNKSEKKLYIDELSYQRYNQYIDLIMSIDTAMFIESYQILQPLIEEAYAEISRPDASFTDVLLRAIDIVLTTPVIELPIELTSPSVMYAYADNDLEALNDAQKLLLRMGPDNLRKIKQKLSDLESQLNNYHQ